VFGAGQSSLPYGGSSASGADPGDVLLHTCSVSYTTSGAGGALTGVVQAVNNTGSTVDDMTIVIDSISDSGTTFGTNLPGNDYGDVPSTNDHACDGTNEATWTFTQTTTTNFSFIAEVDGTVPVTFSYTVTPSSGSSTNFGEFPGPGPSQNETFVITNTGTDVIFLFPAESGVFFSGNSAGFGIETLGTCDGQTLPPGATCQGTVMFDSNVCTGPGNFNAILAVAAEDTSTSATNQVNEALSATCLF